MADNTVPYDRTKNFGQMTAEMITHIAEARFIAGRCLAKAIEMGATGVNGTPLEDANYFGVAAGKGTAFFIALNTLKDNLNGVGANGVAQDKLADLDFGG